MFNNKLNHRLDNRTARRLVQLANYGPQTLVDADKAQLALGVFSHYDGDVTSVDVSAWARQTLFQENGLNLRADVMPLSWLK